MHRLERKRNGDFDSKLTWWEGVALHALPRRRCYEGQLETLGARLDVMNSKHIAAGAYVVATLGLSAFQIALAAGAPWGEYAMGGAYPGVFPPAMRVAALVQVAVSGAMATIVCVRAGLLWPARLSFARRAIWFVVGLGAVAVVLNLITPSAVERMLWAPVAIILFLSALRVAVSADNTP